METLLQDLRYGVRMLLKKPGFTAVAVLALALGIGANTAIFSVVNTVLFKPLPYEEPERLVQVWETHAQRGYNKNPVSIGNFLDWKEQNTVFEQMAAYTEEQGFNLTEGNEPERIEGALVSPSIFPLLRINPILGRGFLPEEDQPDTGQVVVLSQGLWQRRFASDPEIIGKTLKLDQKSYTVVGVLPKDFPFLSHGDLWAPLAFSQEDKTNHGLHYLGVIGRLKQDVSLGQARAEMETVARSLEKQYPETNTGYGVNLIPYHEQVVGNIRQALLVFLGAVGFVLLIACANIANLLLAKASTRQKEFAIRKALGAGRIRLLRQLLTESLILSSLGGVLGLLFALWGLDLIVAANSGNIPRVKEIGLDGWGLGFTVLVTLLTGVIFGLAPAMQASRTDLNQSLKEGGRGSGKELGRRNIRSLLVITEVALALVLLIGAGLMIKSFLRLMEVDPGFNPVNLLTMEISLPESKYPEGQQQAALFEQLLGRIKAIPGVESAGSINFTPLSGSGWLRRFMVENKPLPAPGQEPFAAFSIINTDYFRAMGIPITRGRQFMSADTKGSVPVVIINETMARRFWPGEDPLGKRLRNYSRDDKAPWLMVVGVVGDVRPSLASEPGPQMYVAHVQFPFSNPNMSLIVRTKVDPKTVVSAVRNEILAVDKDQPVFNIRDMQQVIDETIAQRRFNMTLLGLFAAAAMLLASIGIFGVISYTVSQRTNEIGIRMALGAQQIDILKLIIRQSMTMVLIGVAIGLVVALGLTRVISSLLYGVSAKDPITFAGISLLLISVALLACYIPARRATKVDPMVALRYE